MKKFKFVAAQGEVNVRYLDKAPDIDALGLVPVLPENGFLIIGHSEHGHHHGFRAASGVTLMERTKDVPAGMRILYAILENPTELVQNASAPHESLALDAGYPEFRISREFDPFAEQARRVAD